jgi:hypothetical protein
MKHLLFLIGLFVAATSAVFAADKVRQAAEDDVREAVFRAQFTNDSSGVTLKGRIFFLAIGEQGRTDPSDTFLARFATNQPPVRKVSACTAGTNGVRDKQTGASGLIFHVGAIKWISETEAEVEGGFYEAGLSSAGYTFTVKKDGAKWKVTRIQMRWIS